MTGIVTLDLAGKKFEIGFYAFWTRAHVVYAHGSDSLTMLSDQTRPRNHTRKSFACNPVSCSQCQVTLARASNATCAGQTGVRGNCVVAVTILVRFTTMRDIAKQV
jgi:hypothetical protein